MPIREAVPSRQTIDFINSVPVGICLVGRDGRFIEVNPLYCAFLGYTREELIGRTFAEFTHEDDQTRDVNALHDLWSGKMDVYEVEKRYRRKDGEVIWVRLSTRFIRDEQGQPTYTMTVVQDIGIRKRAEQALKESEQRFRTLFEQSPLSVQLLSPEGRTLMVNKAWMELWQVPQDFVDSLIMPEYNVLTDPQLKAKGVTPYIQRALEGESVVVPPMVYDPAENGKIGKARWVIAYLHPLKREDGGLKELMLIHHDVSDEIMAKDELRRSRDAAERANRIKSSFLANISHEIRSPLGAIMGFTEILMGDGVSQTEQKEYLEIIDRSGKSLSRIIDDVLDLTRVEAGSLKIEKSYLSVKDVVSEVADLFSVEVHNRGLILNVSVSPEVPKYIRTDPARVKQILTNLVSNAIKFTHSGSVAIEARWLRSDGSVLISISDTGVGLGPEQRDRIFSPFDQEDFAGRQHSGIGLGLALSKRLAQLLGGDVVLTETHLGEGSTFVLMLPGDEDEFATGVPAPAAQHASQLLNLRLKGLNILIAEDAADHARYVEQILKRQGASYERAYNGREAVEKALSGSFDVVLMDLQMPELDGLSATAALKQQGYDKPIIAVTASAMTEDVARSLHAGCADHLAKPIDTKRLVESVLRHSHGQVIS